MLAAGPRWWQHVVGRSSQYAFFAVIAGSAVFDVFDVLAARWIVGAF
jgi:hypothetical protein